MIVEYIYIVYKISRLLSFSLSRSPVIVIGWERSSHNVSEGEDTVELCAQIMSPTTFIRDSIVDFNLQVTCSPGLAGKKAIL